MIDRIILIQQVAVLILMMIPGFLLVKFHLVGDGFGKSIANVILYVAQPALIIAGFVSVDFNVTVSVDFNVTVVVRMAVTFVLAILAHLIFFVISLVFYKNAPEKRRNVLTFATLFTNAGYMGIPLLEALFEKDFPEIAIYGAMYIFAFNIFCWSIGAYLYTRDKKYISVKKMFLNPATLSTYIGLAIFILSAFTPVRDAFVIPLFRNEGIVRTLMVGLKGLVAPLSMMLIGFRFASVKFKGAFKDKYLYTKNLRISDITIKGSDNNYALTKAIRVAFVAKSSVTGEQVAALIYNNVDGTIERLDGVADETLICSELVGNTGEVIEVSVYIFYDGTHESVASSNNLNLSGHSFSVSFEIDKPYYAD